MKKKILFTLGAVFALVFISFAVSFSAQAQTAKTPPCEQYGDINNDGFVTKDDAVDLATKISLQQLDIISKSRSDVNGDTKRDSADIKFIEDYAVGIINTFPICSSSITVTSPNGGEKLAIGKTHTIVWSTTGLVPNVTIMLDDSSGSISSVQDIVSNIPNSGSYAWFVDVSLKSHNKYKIRVSGTSYSPASDLSDRNFAIYDASDTTPPSAPINISVSKNSSSDPDSKVKFDYTLPSDPDYYSINIYRSTVFGQLGTKVLIGASEGYNPGALTGYFPFIDSYISTKSSGTVYYTVRVVDIAGNESTNTDQYAYSWGATTSMPSITVLSPNGGEKWIKGNTYNIVWKSVGVDKVRVNVICENWASGSIYNVISSTTGGSYSWTVPTNWADQNSCKVQVSENLSFLLLSSSYDMSDASFRIIDATTTSSITITSPNGGEEWIIGNTYDITWKSTGSVGIVGLTLNKDSSVSGSIWGIGNFPNTGSYSWTIPVNKTITSDSDYRISIAEMDEAGFVLVSDESDSLFSIVSASTGKIPPCQNYGDVNDDGVVTRDDAVYLSTQALLGRLTAEEGSRADVNGDGKHDNIDIGLIVDYANGKVDTFPICSLPKYPGFFMEVDASSYTLKDTVALTIRSANPALGNTLIDLYAMKTSDDFNDRVPLRKGLAVSTEKIVQIVLNNWNIFKTKGAGRYTLIICGAGESCSIMRTNSMALNLVVSTPIGKIPPSLNYGDVNNDGVVTKDDAVYLATQALLGRLTAEEARRGDVNGDGNHNVLDTILIINYANGTIDTFPVSQTISSITITSPNGGEIWTVDELRTISWKLLGVNNKWDSSQDSVQIQLWDKTGTSYIGTICITCDSTDSGGSYKWGTSLVAGDAAGVFVPTGPGEYKIRASVVSNRVWDKFPLDFSDSSFTILSQHGLIEPSADLKPDIIYPKDRQILDLEGSYMFKVSPMNGASGYQFRFYQDNVLLYDNLRDDGALSTDGEFALHPSNSSYSKFKIGDVKVVIRAKVAITGAWSKERVIVITLKPRTIDITRRAEQCLAEGTLIKTPNDPKIYVIKDCKKQWIKTGEEFERGGHKWEDVRQASDPVVEAYANYLVAQANLLRAINDDKVYRIISGKKLWIPTAQAFKTQKLNWNEVAESSESEVSAYPTARLIREKGDKKVYFITDNGFKKWIRTAAIFNSYSGNRWEDIVDVDGDVTESFEGVELIRIMGGVKVYKLDGEVKHWVKTAEAFNRAGLDWKRIVSVNEIELISYSEGEVIQ